MRAPRFAWTLWLPFVSLLMGCGDAPSEPLADLPADLAQTICGQAVACGEFPDVETCRALLIVDLQPLMRDVDAGWVEYDEGQAGRCLDALRNTGAGPLSCHLTQALSVPQADSCARAIVGTRGPNADCTRDEQCRDGTCVFQDCDPTRNCCAGKCGPAALMVKGAVCDAPGSVCPAGTYCALGANGASSTCQPQVRENEECNGPEACVPGYVCIRQPSGKRLCGKLPGTGGRCFREQLPSCDSTNDYCDGQKCTRRNGPDAGCAGDDQCLAFTLCARGVCTPRGGRDAGCEAGTECLGPLECVNGRCAPPPAPPACP